MSGEVLAAIMTLCLVIGVSVGAAGMSSVWKEKMVEYGHAQYCPDTGAWAWVGECAQ